MKSLFYTYMTFFDCTFNAIDEKNRKEYTLPHVAYLSRRMLSGSGKSVDRETSGYLFDLN